MNVSDSDHSVYHCGHDPKEMYLELLVCTLPSGRPDGCALDHSYRTRQLLRSIVYSGGNYFIHHIALNGFLALGPSLKGDGCYHRIDSGSLHFNQALSPPGPAT